MPINAALWPTASSKHNAGGRSRIMTAPDAAGLKGRSAAEAGRRLSAALLLLRLLPDGAIPELKGLHGSAADPRLRTKLWPALVALRKGRIVASGASKRNE